MFRSLQKLSLTAQKKGANHNSSDADGPKLAVAGWCDCGVRISQFKLTPIAHHAVCLSVLPENPVYVFLVVHLGLGWFVVVITSLVKEVGLLLRARLQTKRHRG
jgi:hypothetical protein